MSERNDSNVVISRSDYSKLKVVVTALAALSCAFTAISYKSLVLAKEAADQTADAVDSLREQSISTKTAVAGLHLHKPCSRDVITEFDAVRRWVESNSDQIIESVFAECKEGKYECPDDLAGVLYLSSVASDAYFYCPEEEDYNAFMGEAKCSASAFVFVDTDGPCNYMDAPSQIYLLEDSVTDDFCGKVLAVVHEVLHLVTCEDHPKDRYGEDEYDWIYAVGDVAKDLCNGE